MSDVAPLRTSTRSTGIDAAMIVTADSAAPQIIRPVEASVGEWEMSLQECHIVDGGSLHVKSPEARVGISIVLTTAVAPALETI